MSTGAPATSTDNTLQKASSHLRWLVEKSGVDPERAVVCIVVDTAAERDRIDATFAREHDHRTMAKTGKPHQVVANGVKIMVTTKAEVR
jgi:hypothetical protein